MVIIVLCISLVFKNLSYFAYSTRSLGSAAMNLASVASGGCDAYYEMGLHAWDMAAGQLIVEEAGGTVIDTTGKSTM